jgi:hypothetical protein
MMRLFVIIVMVAQLAGLVELTFELENCESLAQESIANNVKAVAVIKIWQGVANSWKNLYLQKVGEEGNNDNKNNN